MKKFFLSLSLVFLLAGYANVQASNYNDIKSSINCDDDDDDKKKKCKKKKKKKGKSCEAKEGEMIQGKSCCKKGEKKACCKKKKAVDSNE